MKVDFNKADQTLTVVITGRVDTASSPELESQLRAQWDGCTKIILDFAAVDYISSAGLRTILIAHQQMMKNQGELILCNLNDDVKEVFQMTGLTAILTLQ